MVYLPAYLTQSSHDFSGDILQYLPIPSSFLFYRARLALLPDARLIIDIVEVTMPDDLLAHAATSRCYCTTSSRRVWIVFCIMVWLITKDGTNSVLIV